MENTASQSCVAYTNIAHPWRLLGRRVFAKQIDVILSIILPVISPTFQHKRRRGCALSASMADNHLRVFYASCWSA